MGNCNITELFTEVGQFQYPVYVKIYRHFSVHLELKTLYSVHYGENCLLPTDL